MTAMKDERMLILSMLQEGKITADEAASLLEALGASRDGDDDWIDEDGSGPRTASDHGAGPGGGYGAGSRRGEGSFQVDLGAMWDDAMHLVGKARDRVEEAIERTRRRMREASRQADEARQYAVDVGQETWEEAREQAGELRRDAMEIGREAVEAGKEAMETGKEALRDAREQVRGAAHKARQVRDDALAEGGDFFRGLERGLSKVAAELPEAMSRLMKLDFGPGAYKEVAWHYEGGFEADRDDAIQIFVSTDDGKIRIEGVDGDEYRVDLINKVWAADEEEAAFVAKEATRWETFVDGLRLAAGLGRDVRSDVVMKLPKGWKYVLDLQTADGNVEVKNLDCVDLRVNSADGSVRLNDVAAETMHLTTADGSIRLHDVTSDKLTALTSDGSIRLVGDVGALSVTASDGSVSATYAAGLRRDGEYKKPGTDAGEYSGAENVPEDGAAKDATGVEAGTGEGAGSGEGPGAKADGSGSRTYTRDRIEWNVRSSDGSVRITVPGDENVGYELDLTAADGTVRVQVPGVEHAAAGTERRGVHVFTPGFAAKPVQFVVRARTADGSVSVRAADGEGA